MIVIVGIIAFYIGSIFGIFVEALMKAAHDEDERMQQGTKKHEE